MGGPLRARVQSLPRAETKLGSALQWHNLGGPNLSPAVRGVAKGQTFPRETPLGSEPHTPSSSPTPPGGEPGGAACAGAGAQASDPTWPSHYLAWLCDRGQVTVQV